MVNKASIDTCIMLRLLLRDVPEQFDAIAEFVSTSGMTFKIPDLAITEAVYVMCGEPYNFSRDKIRGLFGFTFDFPIYEYSREFFKKVFDLYVKRPKLSFNDCYLAYKTAEDGLEPLYTLDKKLAKQAEAAEMLLA